jgi:aminoglycoside phosphotransferase (APT) family kinase protein
MSAAEEFTGTTAVREGHRFDEARLAQWLTAHVAGYSGPLTVEQFKGGQSNPTYKLLTPHASYVMRRKPPGLNIPSEADYVAAYCKRTGREGIPSLDFYIAFNMFRLAAICHGIKGRLARGTAASAHAKKYAAQVEALAKVGWEQAQRAKINIR